MQIIRAVFTIVTGLVALLGYVAASPANVPDVVSFSIGASSAAAVIFGFELLYKRS